MSESFSVGEIAIIHYPAWELHGEEVEIVGGLAARKWRCSVNDANRGVSIGDRREGLAYRTKHSSGEHYHIRPEYLRKRRPPQDWLKLCRLNDLPREVEHV